MLSVAIAWPKVNVLLLMSGIEANRRIKGPPSCTTAAADPSTPCCSTMRRRIDASDRRYVSRHLAKVEVAEPVIFMEATVLMASSSITWVSEACAYSLSRAWEVGRAVKIHTITSMARTTQVMSKTTPDCWAIKVRITKNVPRLMTNSVIFEARKSRSMLILASR